MLPVVTIIGIEAAFLIGGLIVTETVFNIPGVARFLVEAIRSRDYPIVQNLVMFIAVVVVSINFLDRHGLRSCSIRASGTRTERMAQPIDTAELTTAAVQRAKAGWRARRASMRGAIRSARPAP